MNQSNNVFSVVSWYEELKSFTWPTKFVKLQDKMIAALAAGMNEHESKEFLYSADGKEMMNELIEPLSHISGNAFAFVDNCAPTDTERFVNKRGAVYSPRSVLYYLLQSRKVANAAACGEVQHICLRPFRRITRAREFRLFIYEGKLSAMSQYHLIRHYRRLEGVKDTYWQRSVEFVEKVIDRLPIKTLVMDIYITSAKDILIVDLNPWGGETDPLLLRKWDRDWSVPVGIQLMAPPTAVSGDIKVSF